jgi:hypothetical protein
MRGYDKPDKSNGAKGRYDGRYTEDGVKEEQFYQILDDKEPYQLCYGSVLIWIYLGSIVRPNAIIITSIKPKDIVNNGLLEILERGAIKIIGMKGKTAMGNPSGV